MTNKEERPAGCVLRLFGVPEQTVQKAVETLPDTWQGTVHCRTRGAETLVALQSSTPQQLHRAVQQLRTSLAPALYGEGEQTLAAAAVQALEQHRKLLVCSDAAAGALLETRLENLPGAEKVFDFGAMSYANAALNARLSRKLRKAPQAEPVRTLARVQAMQRLTGAALA
ncbi:MAG: CinA family protein, partial [Faecalibacterium prausnitzii]